MSQKLLAEQSQKMSENLNEQDMVNKWVFSYFLKLFNLILKF